MIGGWSVTKNKDGEVLVWEGLPFFLGLPRTCVIYDSFCGLYGCGSSLCLALDFGANNFELRPASGGFFITQITKTNDSCSK